MSTMKDGMVQVTHIKGEEIHIYGRITAVADVFDALGSDRCYKDGHLRKSLLTLKKREENILTQS